MLNANPTNWHDVLRCECDACRALTEIYNRCQELGGFFFVCDCRMYGHGYRIADVRKLFVEPATLPVAFPHFAQAAKYVRRYQRHCDVYWSSFPLKPLGQADYAWQRLEVVPFDEACPPG